MLVRVTGGLALVEEPERVRLALNPLRRQLLDRLRQPASATQLAAELELPRQRVNYHLRELERAGLVVLVEERQRRGCVERILQASAGGYVVDPGVMSADETATFTSIQDRFAADHLVAAAAATVRDVARMQVAAEEAGSRLLTFTIEADVHFARPGDLHEFADALAQAVADTAARFDRRDGRAYRIVVGGHPAPAPSAQEDDS
jgi:DNA-binding transcriptional ArsR family regulator